MDSTAAERRRKRRRVADADRKRAPRACARCKRRKSKCIPAKGTPQMSADSKCQRCSVGNLECKFERAESLSGTGIIQDSDLQPAEVENPSPAFSEHEAGGNSELQSPVSVLSHGLSKHVIADQSKRIPWPNILSRLRQAFYLDPQHVPGEQEMVAMQARMSQQKKSHPSEISRLHAAINAFPPRPVADFLLFVFMKHATDVFFYFDQSQVLADIDEFYMNSNSPLRLDPAFICLAMATFALGSQWTPLEQPEELNFAINKDNLEIGREFSFHAKSLIPDVLDRSCLRSIQAPFILGVYYLPASAIGASYVFLGLALRKALASDLHIRSEEFIMTEREREVRCRLWWSIFSLERCTTVKLNRPRSIDTQIITVPHPSKCPDLDSVQPFKNLECQVAYVRLMKILDEISGIGDGFAELASQPHSKWEHDLKVWKRSLPPNFRLDLMRPNDFKYRAVSHLYLNYYYCLITMGKVALMTVARKKLKQDDCDPPDVSDQTRKLANCCMKAARKTLQLFEILSKCRKITRFSFTDFQGCSIATIVTLVSGIMEKDAGYNLRVELGFKCLRDMAAGNITAKLGVRFVEAVRSITEEAAAKLEPDAPSPHQSSGLGDHSGYYRWKEWHTEQEGLHRDDHMTRQQGTEFPMRADSDEHANPWLTTQSNFSDTCGWPSNVQEGITNPSISQSGLYGSSGSSQSLEHTFPSMIHNDEQSFLMGLTGLDALDFSGLGVQLE